jgi:hypothetical protein
MAYLITIAVRLSGLPSIPPEDYPKIQSLSHSEITQLQCPQNPSDCRDMVAFYDHDKNSIYLRNSLDLESTIDNSFLLHEIVHVLQYRAKGNDIYKDCETSIQSERQAYRIQNTYLIGSGLSNRFGDGLAYMVCSDNQNGSKDEIKIEPVLMK